MRAAVDGMYPFRVQDLDFERNLVCVRAARGGKNRTTVFPKSIQREMRYHVEKVRRLHNEDLAQGYGAYRRHHVLESGLQKAVKVAVNRAGITKRVSCYTFRHS